MMKSAAMECAGLEQTGSGLRGRILVDHTHCGRHVTGLERITLELFSAEALAPLDVDIIESSSRAGMMMQQTFGLPARLAADSGALLICPGFPPSLLSAPMGRRVLPYIHDLFLLTRPQDLNVRARAYMVAPFAAAVRRLPRFLVNSETTCDNLRQFCRADAEIRLYRPQVRNVFGLSPRVRSRPAGGTLRLIAVGTVEPRKNLLAAAAILTSLRQSAFPKATLDIVGRHGWGEELARLKDIPGVTLHGYQNTARIREMLEGADALISTSHDEGLGLPLLEAQYAGLCIIAPDKTVFREVLGDSGLFIEPSDPNAAAFTIAAMMGDDAAVAKVSPQAIANLERWNRQAGEDRAAVINWISAISRSLRAAAC